MKNKVNAFAYENKMTCFKSSSIDVDLKGYPLEIRQDLLLEQSNIGKIWGYVLDSYNNPLEGVTVTLLKREYVNRRQEYITIDTTISDRNGLYQFELKEVYRDIDYIVNIDKK